MYRVAFLFLFLTSCIVQSPKYTSFEQVLSLELGMTRQQVEEKLDLEPYNLKAHTDTTNVYTYVYRVNDRKTLSFYTRKKNGKESIGKYTQLYVAYSTKTNKVVHIESCDDCTDNLVTTSKVDIGKVFTFISVSLPVILVYIGLKSGN